MRKILIPFIVFAVIITLGLAISLQGVFGLNIAGILAGPLNLGTNKITNLGTPTLAGDATTKGYVDSAVGGGDITGVIAGSGLTGGGLSGDVTLNAAETDPQVGTLTSGQWCRGDGSAVQCDQPAPSSGFSWNASCVQVSTSGSPACNTAAFCPAGYKVTGGGCQLGFGATDPSSQPGFDSTAWVCSAAGGPCIVFAICCKE